MSSEAENPVAPAPVTGDGLADEQAYVGLLYGRLDVLRVRSATELRTTRRAGSAGTHAARSERDARVAMLEDRIARFDAVERGLVFGRLDRTDGERHYVGRIGLSGEEYERLLVDWRAPAARAFYTATPGSHEGLRRRRHLRVRDRRVLGIDDEVFDLGDLDATDRRHLSGEAALLAAVTEGRTGRMRDIVATIQAEQDRVIRSGLPGVLVVQGGPGTGKTAVALHRAAYLLYEHRERLASRGVLVVGPSPVFLRYIEQVLPSLGETGVVTTTADGLYPGVTARGTDPVEVAAVKADLRMARVVADAVRGLQRLPDQPLEIRYGRGAVRLDADVAGRARTRARRSRRPHNAARGLFQRHLLGLLAQQVLRAAGVERPSTDEVNDVASDLLGTERVAVALDRLWPLCTPEDLLASLYGSERVREDAARTLAAAERALLARAAGAPWTPADVPLLDEAAERLGPVPERDPLADLRDEEERAETAVAEDVLAGLELGIPVDASLVARRYRGETGARRSAAALAAEDREWTYGHVLVDEAQELSPMAWRMVQRRCPGRSMTVVGDLAQASAPWGVTDWKETLGEYARGRLQVEDLTVNYRTPTEIMAVAGRVLREADPSASVPESIRDAGIGPTARRVAPDRLTDAVAETVTAEVAHVRAGDEAAGTVAVLAPRALAARLDAQLADRLPDLVTRRRHGLDSPAVVLDARAAKGLEFDAVVLVDPSGVVADGPRGHHDLYVALTRATRRLVVLHTTDLPEALRDLPAPASR